MKNILRDIATRQEEKKAALEEIYTAQEEMKGKKVPVKDMLQEKLTPVENKMN